MIPAEAIDAAAKAIRATDDATFDSADDSEPTLTALGAMELARAALEAAAPHMLAEAKAEALEEAADVLKQPRVLWWGGEGVYVADNTYSPPQGSLDHWLRTRAAELRKPWEA